MQLISMVMQQSPGLQGGMVTAVLQGKEASPDKADQ